MTTLSKEIPFPMPHGRRDAEPPAPDDKGQTMLDFTGARGPLGAEEKAKRRDAIRTAVLAAVTSTPPNPFPVAALWDEALCREHPDFAPLLKVVDESLALARPLRDLVEAVNGKDIPTICRLWNPGLPGVSYLTPQQKSGIRDCLVSHVLSNVPMDPHRVDPLVFSASGVEVRWVWRRTYHWLFAIAVRDEHYPHHPRNGNRVGQSTIKTADQCHDGVTLPFSGEFPHVCVWPAVTFDGKLAYGLNPLRMKCRRSPKTRKEMQCYETVTNA